MSTVRMPADPSVPVTSDGTKPPVKEAKKPQIREYAVLRYSENGHWQEVGVVHAISTTDAIRQAVAGKEGVYVAIPVRNFQPQRVKVETTPKVTLEAA